MYEYNIIYRIYYRIRWFFRQIRHVIHWLPILWNDRDDDEVYVFILLRHKLSNMRKTLYPEKVTEHIDTCLLLLDRLIQDEYLFQEYTVFHRNKRLVFIRQEQQHQQDVEYLMSLLAKYIRFWWD